MKNSVTYLLILCLFIFSRSLFAQSQKAALVGEVSYLTSANAYVKFANTTTIQVGDTLFIQNNNGIFPALIVNAKSSTTVVADLVNGVSIEKGQKLTHFSKAAQKKEIVPVAPVTKSTEPDNELPTIEQKVAKMPVVSGRINLVNYSNFAPSSNTSNHRQFAALGLNIQNLGHPSLSAEFYGNYTHVVPSLPSESLAKRNLFRVFNAALNYDFLNGGRITVGRKYSQRLASVGSIDGLQVEKAFGNFFVGAIAGYRPDLRTFAFNSALFQYGGFVGFENNKGKYTSTTTLGYIEQTNSGATDRRYTAFQHSGRFKRVTLFLSTELELYNPTVNKLRLSSLFISANYRFTKKASIFLSYDTRKAIIYYESFYENMAILENDISRDGLRVRFNYSFNSTISAGISASYRFQANDFNKSANYYAYLRLRNLPGIGGDISLAFGLNSSNSLNSQIPSIRYSRDFLDKKLKAYLYYRFQHYEYVKWESKTINNNFAGLGTRLQVLPKLTLNLFGEYSATSTGDYIRFSASISKQF